MKKQATDLLVFFYGQPFEDGLRTTVAVLLPSLVLSYFNLFDFGLSISLGAVCVSLTDAPGPIVHRKNTMLFSILFIFVVALVTGFASKSLVFMGIEILFLSFFFSMFTVYGSRAIGVANAALLAMVLTMDKIVPSSEVLVHSMLLFSGGFWYMLISLAAYKVRPYRSGQRVLGESIREVSNFLLIKAEFYNTQTELEEHYKKLLAQQVLVADKQNEVREVLFKTRQIVEESTTEGSRLVLAFVNAVDLLEDISATYYNYELLRQQYANTGILEDIYQLAKNIASDVDKIGIAVITNRNFSNQKDYKETLVGIKKKIDDYGMDHSGTSNLLLKKMLVNIRRIIKRTNDLAGYFSFTAASGKENRARTHTLFVGHQSLDPKLFWSNLNFSSSVFRHALRVTIASLIGFIIAKSIAKGYHSYWILMTIIFMLKPSFSLTRQRNIERIGGTLIGGMIGFAILIMQPSKDLLFALMVILMIATYSLQRVKYLVSIICMTPFILILFHFLGVGFLGLLEERIIDTFIGCTIALMAGYLLFPKWEKDQLKDYLYETLKSNKDYLQKIMESLHGKKISITDYKLVRKEVYVQSANLSAAFQRMISEPSGKQKNKNEIHQFVVLNHILSSNIASVAETVLGKKSIDYSEQIIHSANKGLSVLKDSLKLIKKTDASDDLISVHYVTENKNREDDALLKEQLEFIDKLCHDIKKMTESIISEETTQ